MSTRILLLGASGLLGTEIIRRRRNGDIEILGIDNKDFTEPELLKNCTARRLDILDIKAFESVVSGFKPQVIINCAVQIFNELPCEALLDACRINAGFNFILLELGRKYSVEKIINCSSVSVYPSGRGLHSEDDIKRPADYYGVTKLLGEEILKTGSERCGIQVINLRLGGLYGINKKGGAVYNFLKAALTGEPLRVPESPALFQFFPASEAAGAIWLAVDKTTDGFVSYNVGLKTPVTLLEVADQIKKLVPQVKIIRTDNEISQMPLMKISKAQQELSWKPQDLSVGIKDFYTQLSECAP